MTMKPGVLDGVAEPGVRARLIEPGQLRDTVDSEVLVLQGEGRNPTEPREL